jgi:hypothetical protein
MLAAISTPVTGFKWNAQYANMLEISGFTSVALLGN